MSGGERRIGPLTAAGLVAGNMIGSGVYLLPATLAPVGGISLLGWLLGALGALGLAGAYAGLALARPSEDGVTEYPSLLHRLFGPQAGLAYWASCWIGNAAIALAAVGYLAEFAPALGTPGPALWAAIGLIVLFALMNAAGARLVARFASATLLIGLVPIVAVIAAGLFRFDPALFAANWNPGERTLGEAVPGSLVLVFWAFLGLESATVCARAVRDPARNIPRAVFLGVGLAAAVYVLAFAALAGLVPMAELARSSAPFADAAGAWLGPAAGLIVAACALAKTLGAVAGWVLVTAEAGRSCARAGALPAWFREPGDGTPRRNLALGAGLMIVSGVLSVSPAAGEQFGVLIEVSTLLMLWVYLLCALALFRLSAPVGFKLAALAGAAFSAWAITASRPELLLIAGAMIVAATVAPRVLGR